MTSPLDLDQFYYAAIKDPDVADLLLECKRLRALVKASDAGEKLGISYEDIRRQYVDIFGKLEAAIREVNCLRTENAELQSRLDRICEGAPTEEPHYTNSKYGYLRSNDVSIAVETDIVHYHLAQIARGEGR